MKRWMGLDIGGTKCAAVLAEADRGIRILDRIAFPTQTERGFEDTFARLTDAADRLLARNDADISNIAAIGVSCGGPLDAKTGIVLCPPNLPGWENIPLCDRLTKRFGVPAYLQNDANACALVEWKLGAGRGADDMVFLTMGTGMGAGIIAGGRLLLGACDMAGEVGHLRIAGDGPVGFGKAGSFEGFTSGGGIARQAVALTERLFARYPALSCCREDIMEAYEMMKACYARGGKLLLAGNGGSCADCEHIVGELMKGFYLKRPLKNMRAVREATDALCPGAAARMQQGLPSIDRCGARQAIAPCIFAR